MRRVYLAPEVLRADLNAGRSMDGKITHIALVVTNQARSLEFFTEKVGFEKKTDVSAAWGTRFVTVGPKGQDLEMGLFEVGTAADPAQKEWSRSWAPARSPPILLRVPDCRQAYEELRARGVEFSQTPLEHPWGTVATFKDPDGNLFSMNQPPSAWPK
jgi:predicted enzyme related to lactoylglutathione lyase